MRHLVNATRPAATICNTWTLRAEIMIAWALRDANAAHPPHMCEYVRKMHSRVSAGATPKTHADAAVSAAAAAAADYRWHTFDALAAIARDAFATWFASVQCCAFCFGHKQTHTHTHISDTNTAKRCTAMYNRITHGRTDGRSDGRTHARAETATRSQLLRTLRHGPRSLFTG